ncbi:hypothetical protein [Gordonia sp. 852002-10350_SCH5691597]|uniref:hypothetical protein n=1 Tax=Gordonia sp. 852002-10350_SCH5691597 TaxID=1834085 RepID=UPI0007EA5FCC|nr:hypothetical protein [Gordonia sp. 852002-10350_SCH5691597]OBA56893.1 hypothetical protein A5777_07770 [Gordonia sp. 852002-10350_SCH5691597]
MTAKTWNEVFTRLDAFCDEFSADVRAVADVDGTDEVEVRSLRGQLDDARAALEAAEVEVGRLKRERDVLPTPDADNPAHGILVTDNDTRALIERAERFAAAHRVEGSSETANLIDDLIAAVRRLTPRVIETRDQLKALPVGSIVLEDGSDGFVMESYWDEIWQMPKWLYPGDDDPQTEPTLPATVLHTPEGGDL